MSDKDRNLFFAETLPPITSACIFRRMVSWKLCTSSSSDFAFLQSWLKSSTGVRSRELNQDVATAGKGLILFFQPHHQIILQIYIQHLTWRPDPLGQFLRQGGADEI